ncbi:4221_t:CDS:1, partial [Scutellospora calospora]
QEKRVDAVIQIANKECQNAYNDIDLLILDKQYFSLDNLLNYVPSNWLTSHNSVIVDFIETLTHNNENSKNELTIKEKFFKKIVAINAIYRSRHKKYVSEINLAISAIKYSLVYSKIVVDINNHIVSFRSYVKFINWLESLSIEQESIPEGLLFLAFDNE